MTLTEINSQIASCKTLIARLDRINQQVERFMELIARSALTRAEIDAYAQHAENVSFELASEQLRLDQLYEMIRVAA